MITIVYGKSFLKSAGRLPSSQQKKLADLIPVLQKNPFHPSLRVKIVQGTKNILEMSVNMNYRITFEFLEGDGVFLRKIGTHNMLRNP